MRARVVDHDSIRTTADDAEIRAAVQAGAPIWIELEKQCKAEDDLLVSVLDIHLLTIEDIWQQRTAPKLEDYRKYLYVIVHGLRPDPRALFDVIELDIVIGQTFLVTHDPHGAVTREVAALLERDPKLLAKGPAWLAHAVLDIAVDHYLPILDQIDDRLEALVGDALARAGTRTGHAVMRRILEYKGLLQELRRTSMMQREILMRLSRGDFDEIPRDVVPFLRDVFDHYLRVNDLIEGYREIVTSALEAYLSVQSNRMNEVMKTLTMISTVMLPLTFIAGVYGMNFRHMPELAWDLGYPFAMVLMAVVTAGILLWFRHKGWLGGDRSQSDDDPDEL